MKKIILLTFVLFFSFAGMLQAQETVRALEIGTEKIILDEGTTYRITHTQSGESGSFNVFRDATSIGVYPEATSLRPIVEAADIQVTESGVLVENGDIEFTLEVNSNVLFTFNLPAWIHEAENNTPATGTHTYSFYADGLPANVADQRSGNITVSGSGIIKTVPVIQIQEAIDPGNAIPRTSWIATSINDAFQDYWGKAGAAIDDEYGGVKTAWLTPEVEPIGFLYHLDLDFGGTIEMRTITINTRWNPTKLRLYTSSDAQTWKSIGELNYQGGIDSETRTLYINPTQTNHLRVEIVTSTFKNGCGGIFDIGITGTDLSGKTYQKFNKTGWSATANRSSSWAPDPMKIIDNDHGTVWQSYEDGNGSEVYYVEVDMKAIKSIAYIGIRERFDCRELTIEGKTTVDGAYTPLGTLFYGTGDRFVQTLVLDRNLPLPQAQFLKISITNSRSNKGLGGIYEVDVWGE
ncbi:MAG: hypothetical protein EZS26_002369 [Candidatus Ordinivivax streblomastigis]|uniref:F5/8 type C domain-containing protein n=1 Tax=Candidatus Ordinivivax streblomastigis TaxID=2540710 RepID=A0A5M8NZC3_9BACT|nr:MAG: hypothetical protein EZS26_002369 [Candidatus Ordinivivax streblomastigis]